MSSDQRSADNTAARSAFIHREFLQVGALLLVAVAAFLATRAVAATNRTMALDDASAWFRQGQSQIERNDLDDAIASFRHATVRDRGERRYVLALARALALKGAYEEARGSLLALREAAPEDPEINLELARLAVRRQDETEALRFYRNALYAPWPGDQADARRHVRLELVRHLISRNDLTRAQSELLAVATDLPADASAHADVGQLFAQAGDHRHALEQFQRSLELAPQNGGALAGAGLAAFQLGDYPMARTFLREAPAGADGVGTTLELTDLVLSSDPLASRIGSVERRRRLLTAFSHVEERLTSCLDRQPAGQPNERDVALRQEEQAFAKQLQPSRVLDQDTVEAGIDLIVRIDGQIGEGCGPASLLDQALLLIGRQHEAGSR